MEDEKLPPNWIKQMSKKRNVPYYYNKVTGVSSWENPSTSVKRSIMTTKTDKSREKTKPKAMVPQSGHSPKTKLNPNSYAINKTPAQTRLLRLRANLVNQLTSKNKEAMKLIGEDVLSLKPPEKQLCNVIKNMKREASALTDDFSVKRESSQSKKIKTEPIATPKPKSTTVTQSNPSVARNDLRKAKVKTEEPQTVGVPCELTANTTINNMMPTEGIVTNSSVLPENTKSSFLPDFMIIAKCVLKKVAGALTANQQADYVPPTETSPAALPSGLRQTAPKREAAIDADTSRSPIWKLISANRNNTARSTCLRRVIKPQVDTRGSANERLKKLRVTLQQQRPQETLPKFGSRNKRRNTRDLLPDIDGMVMTEDEDSCLTEESSGESMDWDDSPIGATNQSTETIASSIIDTTTSSSHQDDNTNKSETSAATATPSEPKKKFTMPHGKQMGIVIDTNVFVHQLSFIKDLVANSNKIPGNPRIVVPYVVIQELDSLKNRKAESISVLAQRAIKYLNEKLQKNDTNILGQSSADNRRHLIDIQCNDDRILNCCVQQKVAVDRVVLLSQDVNLRNKALCNELDAVSYKDMAEEFSMEDYC